MVIRTDMRGITKINQALTINLPSPDNLANLTNARSN
jgi:hypothetical protein